MLSGGEDDLKGRISRIEEAINDRGHICMFLLNYHCALNWTELYWCLAKWHTRGRALKMGASLKQSIWDAFGVVAFNNPTGKALLTRSISRKRDSRRVREYLKTYKEGQRWRQWRSDGTVKSARKIYKQH